MSFVPRDFPWHHDDCAFPSITLPPALLATADEVIE